ncbi:MAG TPA: sigma-54 dependent transcriptional regulator, partial [Albitalea sp.]
MTAAAPTADPAAADTLGHGRAVLVIDDEATLARNVAVYLERLGWVTQVAGSAEEGLARYADFRPDVVLLDHNLPGMSGLEALAKLRGMDPPARVILMTGFGSIDLAVSAMKQGAADYLAKPLALGELKLLLERLLAQSRLENTVDYYRGREATGSGIDKILGASPAIAALRERIGVLVEAERRLTDDDVPTVLVQGETGTGKELVARALHYEGVRAARPFVELNCGALPPQLLEAELFGYEKGAFTDARQRKLGLVETADGGTLFLDEIGEADASTQVKLLKLLEDRRFRRLGGLREQQVNVRVVAATHRPLDQMVKEGSFRADLYFRLRIVQVIVPPLRERTGDVLFLARHFLRWHAQRYRRPEPVLAPETEAMLTRYPWPGNVRELRNAMEQAVLISRGPTISHR